MRIALTGKKGSGKDALAATLTGDLGYTRLAFADAIKSVLLDIDPMIPTKATGLRPLSDLVETIGWERAKREHPHVRALLQRTGMAIRALDPSFWLRITMEQVTGDDVVITDVRMPDEQEAVRAAGFTVVRLVRPELEPDTSPQGRHVLETAMADFEVDRQIINDAGLSELAETAYQLHHLCHENRGIPSGS